MCSTSSARLGPGAPHRRHLDRELGDIGLRKAVIRVGVHGLLLIPRQQDQKPRPHGLEVTGELHGGGPVKKFAVVVTTTQDGAFVDSFTVQ